MYEPHPNEPHPNEPHPNANSMIHLKYVTEYNTLYPGLFQKSHRALLLQSCGAKLSQEGVCSFSYMCLELVVPGITT